MARGARNADIPCGMPSIDSAVLRASTGADLPSQPVPSRRDPRRDELLLAALAHGDPDARDELVRRYGEWVYGLARRLGHDPEAALRTTLRVFAALVRASGSLRPKGRLTPWLYQQVARTPASRGRARALMPPVTDAAPALRLATDHHPGEAGDSDQAASLRRALLAMPEPDREAMILFCAHAMTEAEIAQALRTSREAVVARLHSAAGSLRERLASRDIVAAASGSGTAGASP